MKNITFIILASLTIFTSLPSCKTGLTEDQKVFLDYAKLEDRYHNTNFYLDLDMYSDTIEAPTYYDADFTFTNLAERLKRSFKLVEGDRSITPDYEGASIQYPHQYILRRQADSSYQVDLAVFVPDHFSTISLSRKDIGKVIEKEEASFVLLDMTADGATIMVTDKAKRTDYDYTYDMDRKSQDKERETILKTDPSYEGGLFLGESVTEPNYTDDFVKDSLLRINFSRANITLQDEDGKTLVSDGRINSFRHYLWYRNHDMPYEEMRGDYMSIQYRYKEADKDSMHRFHPIEIINIKGLGKVGSVEILVRSNKGKVERINLGKQVPQAAAASKKSETTRYRPLEKIDTSVINRLLKINYSTVNNKDGIPSYYLLYASLPEAYKNAGLRMDFDEVWMKSPDDSLLLETEDASDYFELGSSRKGSNLTAVKINKPQMLVAKMQGNISISSSGLSDTSFLTTALPAAVQMFNEGKSFTILIDQLPVETLKEIFGLKSGNERQALSYDYDEAKPVLENSILIHFKEAPVKLVFRYRKDEGLEYSKPFEVIVAKPTL